MSDVDPIIGNWYRNQDTGNDFEVVALDEEAQTIEIQYVDGDVEELEFDAWYELPIDAIEAPEDWSGPFELEPDELGYDGDEADAPDADELSDEDDLLADRDED
ncbi:MAG: DUF6763 family protein [Candidatus Contendobacter sp.]